MQLQYAASVSVRLEYLHPCLVGDVVSVQAWSRREAGSNVRTVRSPPVRGGTSRSSRYAHISIYSDVIRTRMVFVRIFSPPAVGSTGKGCKAQTGQCCRNVEYGAPSSNLATASPLIWQPYLQLLGHTVQRSPYSRLQLRQLLAPLTP